MGKINNTIKVQRYDGLQVQTLTKTDVLEILLISLEKDTVFPEHTSPKETQLLVLEGEIDFHIKNEKYNLTVHQHFDFQKDVKHWVKANKNSKFLIIR